MIIYWALCIERSNIFEIMECLSRESTNFSLSSIFLLRNLTDTPEYIIGKSTINYEVAVLSSSVFTVLPCFYWTL